MFRGRVHQHGKTIREGIESGMSSCVARSGMFILSPRSTHPAPSARFIPCGRNTTAGAWWADYERAILGGA